MEGGNFMHRVISYVVDEFVVNARCEGQGESLQQSVSGFRRSASFNLSKFVLPTLPHSSHAAVMEALAIASPSQSFTPLINHRRCCCPKFTSLSFSSCHPHAPFNVSVCTATASAAAHYIKCSATSSPSASSTPSLADYFLKFKEATKDGNLVPMCRCIFSDHSTPVLAYRCLVKEDDRDAPSFLFESVEPGYQSSSVGRYSVVGAQPTMEIVAKENSVMVMDHFKGQREEKFVEDPMEVPRRIMENWKPQSIEGLPEAFCGGWVGYFSYDTVRYVEKKKIPFSNAPVDDRNLPDVHLGLYDVIVFDHVEKKPSKMERAAWNR